MLKNDILLVSLILELLHACAILENSFANSA